MFRTFMNREGLTMSRHQSRPRAGYAQQTNVSGEKKAIERDGKKAEARVAYDAALKAADTKYEAGTKAPRDAFDAAVRPLAAARVAANALDDEAAKTAELARISGVQTNAQATLDAALKQLAETLATEKAAARTTYDAARAAADAAYLAA